jgi:hypothetical protein
MREGMGMTERGGRECRKRGYPMADRADGYSQPFLESASRDSRRGGLVKRFAGGALACRFLTAVRITKRTQIRQTSRVVKRQMREGKGMADRGGLEWHRK